MSITISSLHISLKVEHLCVDLVGRSNSSLFSNCTISDNWYRASTQIQLKTMFWLNMISFHSVGVYKWNWTMCVCMSVSPSSLRRWSLFLLVGFTDPYNHTYSESLWWKMFKNHNRTQIQGQRQWQRQRQRQRHIQSARKPNICYIFEILMTYSFQIWW